MRRFQNRIAVVGLLLTLLAGSGCAVKEVATETVYFPPLPAQPRLVFLEAYNSSNDVEQEPGGFARYVAGAEDNNIELDKPYGIAIHQGKIYVCDTKGSVVHVLDPVNRSYHLFGNYRAMSKPINITFDEQSNAYLADTGLNQVLVFDAEEQYLRSMGDSNIIRPTDIAIRGDDLYVCDLKSNLIRVWDKSSGSELRTIGEPGSDEGQLFQPTNILLGPEGQLYVTDTGNFRIQVFGEDGSVEKTFGGIGRSMGRFSRPKGIAIDHNKNLYVVDAGFENIQIFDDELRLLLFFGEAGNNPGQVNLPSDVCVNYELVDFYQNRAGPEFTIEYLVFVASQYGSNKINVYGYGQMAGGNN